MKVLIVTCVLLLGSLWTPNLARAQDHGGCLGEAMSSMSFLVGEWRVESRFRGMDGKWEETIAHSRITSELGGCLLRERFSGSRGGAPFEGLSALAYSSLDGRFQRTWIDDGHGLLVLYDGKREGDALVLSTSMRIRDREVLFQHAYSKLSKDSFELESRRSVDGGATWDTGWYLRYSRVRAK